MEGTLSSPASPPPPVCIYGCEKLKLSLNVKNQASIDAHRGGKGGEGGDETAPPRQIFEKLVNKNAIRGTPPGNFS
jgi:hypothetical protein